MLSGNFKRDIFFYFLSVIIPGAVNFFSIPLIKWFLGANGYGQYALWYSAFLIVVSTTVGWLGMGIIRFRADFEDQDFFYKSISRIIFWLGLALFFLALSIVFMMTGKLLFSLLFASAVLLFIFQNAAMAISQANYHSRAVVYSESIRSLSFLTGSILLLKWNNAYYLEKLFFALSISYTLSFLFLKRVNGISIAAIMNNNDSASSFPYRDFFRFGIPLMFWYLCSTSIPYLDKLLIAHKYGNTIQGNYQALFDLIYRGVGIVMVPMLTASFPYLTRMYNEGPIVKVTSFLNRLILIEFGVMILAVFFYYMGGASILMHLLHIEENSLYLPIGTLILIVAFIWQIAMLLHKPFELMKRTDIILKNNIIALVVTITTLLVLYGSNISFAWYPVGILTGAVSYALLCLWQARLMFKKKTVFYSPAKAK